MMRNLHELDSYRVKTPDVLERYGFYGDATCGAFELPSLLTGVFLRILASSGNGWDHVSVSLESRCPTWNEMSHVKRTFFKPNEVVMQLHVADSDHINFHPNVLHLWRPHDDTIPLPPKEFV
jgi:hypothetical protein